MGCNYCLKPFPSVEVQQERSIKNVMDYSNFQINTFEIRTKLTHLKASEMYRNAANNTERDAMKKAHGTLYTEFLRLSYFNPISMGGIDVMHLLLNSIIFGSLFITTL